MIKIMLLVIVVSLSGCIGTVIGTAVDITTEIIKVPFKVGGAIVDVVSDDDEEENEDE